MPLTTSIVARCVADHWGLTDVSLVPHHGGMNSQTWLVSAAEHGAARWVAKSVPSGRERTFLAGLVTARHVQAAGIPAGAPLPSHEGDLVVPLEGQSLALLGFVEGAELAGRDERERRLIGTTLARAHRALAGVEVAGADRFHWLDPAAGHLGLRDWLRPAVISALAALERLRPASLTWGMLHSDPAPEAFRFDAATGITGLIDWDTGLLGPLLYDLASAVMYVRGPAEGRDLVDAYLSLGVMRPDEVARGLLPILRFRWAVQADYFARRIATSDLTGIDTPADNEQGLADARHWLGQLSHQD